MKDFNKWLFDIFLMKGKCENKRTKEILNSLGFKKNFKIVNIVGTNGKGSTTHFIYEALMKNGFSVGKFTSPHLFKFNERIEVNGVQIRDEEFFNIINPIVDVLKNEKIMFYPITYIAAMIHFMNSNLDFVVLEAGIGGKYDPTDIIDGEYGAITSISVDHMEWFKTRENITVDKSAIMNDGMHFFYGSSLDDADKKIILSTSKEKNAKIHEVKTCGLNYADNNKAIANAVFKKIVGSDISEFNMPFGRTSTLKVGGIKHIFDVAHNYDAFVKSLELMREREMEFDKVVISLSSTKDDTEIGNLFKGKEIFFYEHKGPSPRKASDYAFDGTPIANIDEFIKTNDKKTLFIGSFYLASELKRYVN